MFFRYKINLTSAKKQEKQTEVIIVILEKICPYFALLPLSFYLVFDEGIANYSIITAHAVITALLYENICVCLAYWGALVTVSG